MIALDCAFAATTPRRLGLIVLRTDEVIERELARILPLDDLTRLHVTRIWFDADVTGDTLARMQEALPGAARLFPDVPFDVVGYGCTSGATVIGPDRITALTKAGCAAGAVCDPITSVVAAAHHLGARKIGLVTPYIPSVSNAIRDYLEVNDLSVTGFGSFGIKEDRDVARIDPAAIRRAIVTVAEGGCDAVFASCTNLAALDVIAAVETEIGMPVLTSNQALAWSMCRAAGIAPRRGFGCLLDGARAA